MILGLVLTSSRHRSFYLGSGGEEWPPAPSPRAAAPQEGHPTLSSRAASAVRKVAAAAPRVQTFGLPLGPRNEAIPAASLPDVSPARRGKARPPRPDAQGRVRVPIADALPVRLPAAEVPLGWDLTEFAGRGGIEVVRDEGRAALRLRSERGSFALHRDVVLNLKEYPMLEWSWKAVRLPAGADGRERAADDQVAQVYIIIPRWPFPRVNSDVVGYLWDTRAPIGTRITNPQASNVRSLVVESGYQRLGSWVREERDVYRDYVDLFGREPSRVGKVAILTDSNDTGTESEVLIDDLVFFRPPARNAGIGSVYAKMPHMSRSGI